jgi:hypothetical protein
LFADEQDLMDGRPMIAVCAHRHRLALRRVRVDHANVLAGARRSAFDEDEIVSCGLRFLRVRAIP